MSSPMRVTLFTLGGALLVTGIGTAGYTGLVALSSHDVKASTEFDLPGNTLWITSDGGSVRLVRGEETGKTSVDRTTTESIHGANPKWEMTDGRLRLDTNCPGFMSVMCEGKYTVTVPRNVTTVTVRNDNGAVRAEGLTMDRFDLRSNNGSINVRDSVGELKLQSDNGSISVNTSWADVIDAKSDNGSVKMTLQNEPQSVRAESDNGSVRVTVPESGTKYNVDAHTDNGSRNVQSNLHDPYSLRTLTLLSDNGSVKAQYGAYPPAPLPEPRP
ncbi:DUF4097 domain-containing protein [Yinghuangia sp. ASG 101]|uniref:DUF4097 family beta strand repeat-containing protein n=1 Tax=Yinghuangia sp. ASG 101 TaxID=2896848 RepID=UPI001E50C322|nr:DUF4097 family beta strand repeat-containing protein [Yinghuangia sp. ASG 101]UGQ14366.1 DUF4097 domain-containing protein [Yinghuangia sp. ASG 101]